MPFEDKKLTCKECENTFVFSVSEQDFFARKGFVHEPARCPECRKKKREEINKEMVEIKCDQCGKTAKVLLYIKKNIPVYCQECFDKIKKESL